MTVKVEGPVLESEPIVINEQLTRQCAELSCSDPSSIEEKRKTMQFREIEWLTFSFKNIARICNLEGLDKLTRLQLDNNVIAKIEHLDHLTNLTWLDLSFNNISKIEGLETLTQLRDLSLFNNNICVIENLDTLTDLQVLSLGNNNLKKLDNVMYLRQFMQLRLLKLSGNPISNDLEYKSYVLSHISQLTYLDYRRILPNEVTTALEHHQDEMMEIHEKEEHQQAEEQAKKEREEHTALMKDANLIGVETLMDDMVREDGEWARLSQVPGLLDGWSDTKDKFNVFTEEFKNTILGQLEKKQSEYNEWKSVVQSFLDDRDAKAKGFIMEYEKLKKRTLLGIAQEEPINVDALLVAPRAKLMQLKVQLLDLEQEVVEVVEELCTKFEGNYAEVVEANKGFYNTYFAQVRDLENSFAGHITSLALQLIEKYANENDGDQLSEDARTLVSDKDTLMNALQASHDSHTSKIDASEDRLINQEIKNTSIILGDNAIWERKRNRDRVAEIVHYIERNMNDLDEAGAEDDSGDHYR